MKFTKLALVASNEITTNVQMLQLTSVEIKQTPSHQCLPGSITQLILHLLRLLLQTMTWL